MSKHLIAIGVALLWTGTAVAQTITPAGGGGTPGGSNGQIQYNNSGAFGGTATGTGVLTALGVNVGSAGAFVTFGGALGTPSSGVATNLTGLPLTTGVTGVLLGANGGTGIANTGITETFAANFTTTGAGAPTLAFPASSATYTFPTTTATLARTDAAQGFTGLQTISLGATLPTVQTNVGLQIAGLTSSVGAIEIDGFAAAAVLHLTRADTSSTAPSAVTTNDALGTLTFRGWDTSAYQIAAQITATAAETFTSGANRGTYLGFFTSATGGGTATQKMRLQGSGGLSVGNANIATDGGAGVVVATSFTGAGTGLTGTAASLTAGTVTTNANLTGPITSVGNATSVAAQTGTGTTFVMSAGPTLTGSLTLSSAALITSGNLSAAAWTTNGVRTQMAAASYTDTSSSGTVANAYTDLFGVGTILASSATVYTNYYGAFFKAPVASTNVTMTNKSALGSDSVSIGGQAQSTFALAVSGTSNFNGAVTGTSDITAGSGNAYYISGRTRWYSAASGEFDFGTSSGSATYIFSVPTNNTLQLGAADVNTGPVAQTLRSQGALAGGTSDVAGANFTFIASPGKGTGAGGSFIFQTTPAGSTGTVVGTATTALTINSAQSAIFAGTTDATSTTTGAIQIAGGVSITKRVFAAGLTASAGLQTAVICLSSANELIADSVACLASSERFKQDIAPSDLGLAAVMAMQPIVYRYAPTGNARFDNAPNQRDIHAGFRAEDLAKIDRRLVAFDADGVVRTARQDGITASLVKAVQEQQAKIDAIERRLH